MKTPTSEIALQANLASPELTDISTATPRRKARRMARDACTEGQPAVDTPSPTSAPRAPSKIDGIIALLRRAEGATLAEMTEVTGWLPHTMRAALTGLRKKGYDVVKAKRGETTCYHLAEAL